MSLADNLTAASARTRAARPDWVAAGHLLLLVAFLAFTFVSTQSFSLETPAERIAGSAFDRLFVPAMALLSVALIAARREAAWTCLRANKLLVLVILFSLASIFWSDYPDLTLRRAMLFALLAMITLGIAASIEDLPLFHARLFRSLFAVIVANLAVTALWPAQTITDIGVAGLYGQKNPAGLVAMIAVVVSATYVFGARRPAERVFGFVGAACALFFLALTRSKTSISLTFMGLGVGLIFWTAQKLGPRFALLVFGGLSAAVVALLGLAMASDFNGQQLLGTFLTDTTFTGRSELWDFAWRSALQRPWLGHGYGAFWDVGAVDDPLAKLEPGTWLGDVSVGVINQAPNGYIELCLHIGLPMTFVAVCAIVASLFMATRKAIAARASVAAAYAMAALILFLHLLHNQTEASLFMRGESFCNLVFLLCFAVARETFARRSRYAG
jgi:O-antigen ligase